VAGVKVVIYQAGVDAVLRSAGMVAALEEVAGQIADNVAAQGLTVESPGEDSPGTSLHAEASTSIEKTAVGHVTIPHPAGIPMQARHGVLTKAAAAAGLEVKS
jgi:hypothetical protein